MMTPLFSSVIDQTHFDELAFSFRHGLRLLHNIAGCRPGGSLFSVEEYCLFVKNCASVETSALLFKLIACTA